MINSNIIEVNCSECNRIESQDHVTKFQSAVRIRREFVKDLVIKLVKKKPRDASIEVIMSFMENILRYLDNKEEDDY